MKQREGSSDCYAIVACMITKQPLSKFKWLYGTPPYLDPQFFHFLLLNGWMVGLGYEVAIEKKYVTIESSDSFTFDWELEGNKAAIITQSETKPDARHVIYWDGEKIWDPNPQTPDGRDLNSYQVDTIWPITKMDAWTWANLK